MYLPVLFAGIQQLSLVIWKAFPDDCFGPAGACSQTAYTLYLYLLIAQLYSEFCNEWSWVVLFILLCQHAFLARITRQCIGCCNSATLAYVAVKLYAINLVCRH